MLSRNMLVEKMWVYFCTPTGSGKSLTFEIAPFVLSYLKDKTPLPSVYCIVEALCIRKL